MEELFQFYRKRYSYDDTFAVVRSIIYFADAEDDIDPDSLEKITWSDVKKVITKAFDEYFKSRIK